MKWTYKTYNAGKTWGIFNKDVERIDIKTVSYEEILTFIKENAKTQSFKFNPEEMAILR